MDLPTPEMDSDSGHGSSLSDFVDANSDIDYDDSESDFEDDHAEPPHCPQMPAKPKSESSIDLLVLPTNVLENVISKLDTGSLHAFRNTSHQAAKLAEFRGIQTHQLHVEPEMRPGQVHSIQKKGKIITRASLDVVLNTERVKVRHLFKIGTFHAASAQLVADHIDSRFTSVVLEGHVYYKTLYSLIVPGKTVTLRLKDGIRLPSSEASRFWNYFPGQPVTEVRNSFNSNHVIVKATYDAITDSHSLRVVPAICTRMTVDL
uniref:F-box domain-containing protein n=1 Tax=Panagrellus redivivus TaxID=6233 RepID=A0A7E4VB39_PANRE